MKTNYSNSVILNNAAVNTYVEKVRKNKAIAREIREFVKIPLRVIMDDLSIDRYLLGGTAALIICYDIPIRQEMKDIDVIVPEGTIAIIREKIKLSPFYSIVSEHENYNHYDNEHSHIEIKCIQGFAVDIVETTKESFEDMYMYNAWESRVPYCPLINILEVKNKWRRPKDLDDLFFIEQLFETIGIEEIEEQKQRDLSDRIAIEEMIEERERIRQEEEEELKKEQMKALHELKERLQK